jgi:hypothetical protein
VIFDPNLGSANASIRNNTPAEAVSEALVYAAGVTNDSNGPTAGDVALLVALNLQLARAYTNLVNKYCNCIDVNDPNGCRSLVRFTCQAQNSYLYLTDLLTNIISNGFDVVPGAFPKFLQLSLQSFAQSYCANYNALSFQIKCVCKKDDDHCSSSDDSESSCTKSSSIVSSRQRKVKRVSRPNK